MGTCPGSPDFFLFEGLPTGCGEIYFLKLFAGIVADNGAINAANFLLPLTWFPVPVMADVFL